MLNTDNIEVCVSDTDKGIPEDNLEDMFKSFKQVDNSLMRRHGGTGSDFPSQSIWWNCSEAASGWTS